VTEPPVDAPPFAVPPVGPPPVVAPAVPPLGMPPVDASSLPGVCESEQATSPSVSPVKTEAIWRFANDIETKLRSLVARAEFSGQPAALGQPRSTLIQRQKSRG
jgi:hypothetical protein